MEECEIFLTFDSIDLIQGNLSIQNLQTYWVDKQLVNSKISSKIKWFAIDIQTNNMKNMYVPVDE